MNIYNESEYEIFVRSIIEEHIVGGNSQLMLLAKNSFLGLLFHG